MTNVSVPLRLRLKRHKFLLSILTSLPFPVTSSDMQKIVFLASSEHNYSFYSFIYYDNNFYSFQLAEDIKTLENNKHIFIENIFIHVTNSLPVDNLLPTLGYSGVEEVNRKTCDYHDNHTRVTHNSVVPRKFYTIGYEGRNVEDFVNILLENNSEILVDVRRNPISRKFGFSKKTLQHILEYTGITYVHIPILGVDSKDRKHLETIEDYHILFSQYEKSLLENLQQISYLCSLIKSQGSTALMCFEKNPSMCHRHVLSEHIASITGVLCYEL